MKPQQPQSNQAMVRMLVSQLDWVVAVGLLLFLCVSNGINFVVPFVLLISAWFFKIGFQNGADANALEKSLSSDLNNSFKDGQWVAMRGALRPLVPGVDRALPNILAYYFRVSDLEKSAGVDSVAGTSSSKSKRMATRRFDGFYLVPTGISTKQGLVKLNGFPDLTSLQKSAVPNDIFMRSEAHTELGVLWLPSYLQRVRFVSGIAHQADKVIKYGDRDRTEIGSGEYMSLRTGDEVCVFGRWQSGALVADTARPRGLPIYTEPPDKLGEELKGDARAFKAAGVFFLAISLGLIGWSYW